MALWQRGAAAGGCRGCRDKRALRKNRHPLKRRGVSRRRHGPGGTPVAVRCRETYLLPASCSTLPRGNPMRFGIIAASVAVASMLAGAAPARAAVGAFAYDEATGKYGASWNQ